MTAETGLQARMLAAHERNDLKALPALYLEAARARQTADDVDAACFFYTHAYVYALDAGDFAVEREARAALRGHGRDL